MTILGRKDRLRKAVRLYERGYVDGAARLVRDERQQAEDAADSYRLAEIDAVTAEMRHRLKDDDRLLGFEAVLDGNEINDARAVDAQAKDEVDITPVSLAIALIGAGVMLVAIFLPQFESSTFNHIEKNSFIQNGQGWSFIVLAVLVAGSTYRAYHAHRRAYAPVFLGLIGIGLAIYYGTAHSQLRLCSVANQHAECSLGTPGIGIYAAGVGSLLVAIGGWGILRAKVVDPELTHTDAASSASSPPAALAPPSTIADRLTTLDQLLADSLITDTEHAQRRTDLLNEI